MLNKLKTNQRVNAGNEAIIEPYKYAPPALHPITKVPLAGTMIAQENQNQASVDYKKEQLNPTTGVPLAGSTVEASTLVVQANGVNTRLPSIIPAHTNYNKHVQTWLIVLAVLGAGASLYAAKKA